jgi:hypothetical protein
MSFTSTTGTGFGALSSDRVFLSRAGTYQILFDAAGVHLDGSKGYASSATGFGSAADVNMSRIAASTYAIGNGTAADFSGTLKLTTLQGGATLTLNNASSGTLTFGANAVTPASTGTRYLCISTAGVVTSSASACSGT